MSFTAEQREQIRQRAGHACEYCGVTETDTAGLLTVDHFHPQSKGGSDDLTNLIYCCHSCNRFKSDYWPQVASDPILWNPRQDARVVHFVEVADGRVFPITSMGTFTLGRLRLNRPALVANRLRRTQNGEEQRLLTRLRDVIALMEQLQAQHRTLQQEHSALLQEQHLLLQLLLRRQERGEEQPNSL